MLSQETAIEFALVLPEILDGWSVNVANDFGAVDARAGSPSEEFAGDGFTVVVGEGASAPLLIAFQDLAAFSICHASQTITCRPLDPQLNPASLEHLLLDQIVPRIIGQRGELVLHAAGVAHDGGVLLFMGETGRGKSTLATSLHVAGARLLGDDAMIVRVEHGVAVARPVYPSLRLLPDSRSRLLPADTAHEPIGPHTRKERISLLSASSNELRFMPIKGIFILEDSLPGCMVSLRALGSLELCLALTRNSFALNPADNRSAARRLRTAAAVADLAIGHDLHFVRDYALLPQVHAAIFGAAATQADGESQTK